MQLEKRPTATCARARVAIAEAERRAAVPAPAERQTAAADVATGVLARGYAQPIVTQPETAVGIRAQQYRAPKRAAQACASAASTSTPGARFSDSAPATLAAPPRARLPPAPEPLAPNQ